MKAIWLILLYAAASPVATPALAQGAPPQAHGAALLASCRANEAQCGAYLQGVLDELIAQQTVCDPPRYDRAALRAAYLRWAETDTYFRDKHMMAGAERALSVAWPCRAIK